MSLITERRDKFYDRVVKPLFSHRHNRFEIVGLIGVTYMHMKYEEKLMGQRFLPRLIQNRVYIASRRPALCNIYFVLTAPLYLRARGVRRDDQRVRVTRYMANSVLILLGINKRQRLESLFTTNHIVTWYYKQWQTRPLEVMRCPLHAYTRRQEPGAPRHRFQTV